MAWLIDELGRFDCKAESSVSGGGEEPSASIVVLVALERVSDQTGLGSEQCSGCLSHYSVQSPRLSRVMTAIR